MTEVVVFRHPDKPLELVYDTDDVVAISSPRDVYPTTCEAEHHEPCGVLHQVLGHAHLALTFAWGKSPVWREVSIDEPFARPLPRPVPEPLATAIRTAKWTEGKDGS